MSLTGKQVKNTYQGLLNINSINQGFDTSAQSVLDGLGVASPLSLATDKVLIHGTSFPSSAGSIGYILSTDGAGASGWIPVIQTGAITKTSADAKYVSKTGGLIIGDVDINGLLETNRIRTQFVGSTLEPSFQFDYDGVGVTGFYGSGGGVINVVVASADVARFEEGGATVNSPLSVITREKGDARYALTSGKTTNDFNVNRLFVQNNGSAGAPAIRFTGASGTVGINVSANGKNLSFSVNGATSGIIDEPGTAAVNTVTVITREKGDARYTQISSDENLKENIIDAVSATPVLKQLRPVMYNFKADISARQHFGLIAQEVQQILPNAVLQGGEGLGLELKDLVGLLIKANQELISRIEYLEGTIATLISGN